MTARTSLFASLCGFLLATAGSPQSAAQTSAQSQNVETAELQPHLVWQRTSPTVQHPDGPVLYQLLFSASGTPGTLAKFDTNPRHLANSLITDNGSQVAIGGLSIASNGIITFANGQTFPGTGGTVTSVGLAAPASDFSVSGSPVTGSGALSLNWTIAPSSSNTANAIVKRDGGGNFSAGAINASNISAVNSNTLGIAIAGRASATSGLQYGVYGESDSPAGTAGNFNNTAGGKTLSGYNTGVEVFSVAANGVKTIGFQMTTGAASGRVLTSDGSGIGSWQSLPPPAWSLTGNSGTGCTSSPCADSLGTIDNSSFEIQVNGQRAYRIEPATQNTLGSSFAPNVVGGFSGNNVTAGAGGATIAGGGTNSHPNSVSDDFGSVGGGWGNTAGNSQGATNDAAFATVAGGESNTAAANDSTIGGGAFNSAVGFQSTVGGGRSNQTKGGQSTISGGGFNVASGLDSTIGGGANNTASGFEATVPGGVNNIAGGTGSFAAGGAAQANEDGSFVWGDGTRTATSQGASSFSALATGGFFFFFNIANSDHCTLNSLAGWSCTSDRNAKEDFQPVDEHVLLERLRSIPIPRWHGKGEPAAVKHMGPMAQDFYAAFHLGNDDKTIGTTDAQGVALAAIQGLYEMVEEKDAKIRALSADAQEKSKAIAALTAEIAAQRNLTQRLLQRITTMEQERSRPSVASANVH